MTSKVLAVIPARGGSQSIPYKNIVQFNGRPLIEYVVKSAQASSLISKVICSTDDKKIADIVSDLGVETYQRPDNLSTSESPIIDTLIHIAKTYPESFDYFVLLQPTSPFITPADIDKCIIALEADKNADSSQTISPIEHNHHAYNQRIIKDDYVDFRFKAERRECYNKQTKPKHYVFGNLVVSKYITLVEKQDVFGDCSIPLEIDSVYAFDLDTYDDVNYGEYLIQTGVVSLPWLDQ
jgi:CMP-N,N'-diacetyllegionaminic acid synthase